MLASYNWLKEYVDIPWNAHVLAEKLTETGLAVDRVERPSEMWKDIPAARDAKLDDWILEIDLTPNRPDCLSMYGIAREIAAISGKQLKTVKFNLKELGKKTSGSIKIVVESPKDCPRYLAKMILNVKIGPSPAWLVEKLLSVGQRPINNVVDVTNFVMLELGQPLHAFDYDRLSQRQIVVRRAKKGEKLVTLDGAKHELDPEVLLITDGTRPLALAGIMGGAESEVTQTTKNILLESAYFSPMVVRRGRNRIGTATESSSRFEKGTDPNIVDVAARRAAALIAELSGGEVLKGEVDKYPRKIKPKTILLNPDRINRSLGVQVKPVKMTGILQGLGFKVGQGKNLKVTIPTFRPDCEQEADIVEEIARIYGYQNFPAATTNKSAMQIRKSDEERWIDLIREKLSGWGVQEIVTNPLVDPKKLEWFGQNGKSVDIINPVTAEFSVMRTNLALPALMVVLTNLNRKQTDLKFFEIGKVYRFEGEKPQEELRLCLALSGNQSTKEWDGLSRPVDFYDVKGLIDALARQMQIETLKISPESSPILHGDFSFGLESKSGNLGSAGKVSAAILEKMDIKQEVWLAEMKVDALLKEASRSRRFEGLAKFPAVERDLAVVVDKSVLTEQIGESIKDLGGGWVEEVRLFDYYHGKQIPSGKKSLAFHLVFRSPEKTLTEMEVSLQMERIVEGLQSKFNAQIRS